MSTISSESQGFRGGTILNDPILDAVKNFNNGQTIHSFNQAHIWPEKAGVKNMVSTKIEFNHNKIARIQDLSDLARMLFPGNRSHQKVFLAIFIELKYAEGQFLPTLAPLCRKYDFSPRMLETVRAKMRRMGLIDHVSRFNRKHGNREGWVFSSRLLNGLRLLLNLFPTFITIVDNNRKFKDIRLHHFI